MAAKTFDRGNTSPAPSLLSKRDVQDRFLAAFAECDSVEEAANRAGLHRQSHYYWMKTDQTYPARFNEVRGRRAVDLEGAAIKRSKGVRKPILYQGKPVYFEGRRLYEYRYDGPRLRLLLRANAPEKYGNRPIIRLNLAGWDGDISRLSERAICGILKLIKNETANEEAAAKFTASVQHDSDPANTLAAPAPLPERESQSRFLAAFARCHSVLEAARCAGVHRQSHYYWMRTDPSYPERFRDVRERVLTDLEDEAVGRAKGTRKPMLYKGKPVYDQGRPLYEDQYDDAMLMFLLEGWAPEKYGNRPIVVVKLEEWNGEISRLSDGSRRELLEILVRTAAKEQAAAEYIA